MFYVKIVQYCSSVCLSFFPLFYGQVVVSLLSIYIIQCPFCIFSLYVYNQISFWGIGYVLLLVGRQSSLVIVSLQSVLRFLHDAYLLFSDFFLRIKTTPLILRKSQLHIRLAIVCMYRLVKHIFTYAGFRYHRLQMCSV